MNQLGTIHRLTSHLKRIEAELSDIKRELKTLPKQQAQLPLAESPNLNLSASKVALKQQMRQLFLNLSIQEKPVGAEMLQSRMRDAGLTANELS